MPDSTAGQWPAIWFLPNDAPAGGSNGDEELDMHEGGFLPDETGMPSNTPINNNFAPNYHQPSGAAVISPAGSVSSGPLDTGYHIYGMEIIAGKSAKFYLDGALVTQTTVGIPTEPWELVIWNAFATARLRVITLRATRRHSHPRFSTWQRYRSTARTARACSLPTLPPLGLAD